MLKILVVEDKEDMRDLLTKLLRRSTFTTEKREIFSANNGFEAQRILEQESINLVITDTEMPEMGGVELTDWIKTNLPRLPVILMSGRRESSNHRANVFLEKPLRLERLEEVIKTLLQIKVG